MIRKATAEDIRKINELGSTLHKNFEKTYHLETELTSKLSIILVALENNKIKGYLYAQNFEDNIDLLSIVVENKERNKSIGTNLLNELKKIALTKTITLEVSDKNKVAYKFYEKNDFQIVATRKNYYTDGSNALLMKWGI